jgi:hypothetical protein
MRFQTFRSQSSAVAVHEIAFLRLKMSDNSGVRNILSDKRRVPALDPDAASRLLQIHISAPNLLSSVPRDRG